MQDQDTELSNAFTPLASARLRRRLDLQGGSLMVVFCLALGFQQVAIKAVAIDVAIDVAPLAQIALRSAMAALFIAALAFRQGIRLADLQAHLAPGLLVGAGFTAEFVFVAWGLNYTLASHMSVFLYTAPIFAALGLHWLVPGEQLSRRQWLGVGLAFGGMVLAMAPSTAIENAGDIPGSGRAALLPGRCDAGPATCRSAHRGAGDTAVAADASGHAPGGQCSGAVRGFGYRLGASLNASTFG